jgi:hypothetical protein
VPALREPYSHLRPDQPAAGVTAGT